MSGLNNRAAEWFINFLLAYVTAGSCCRMLTTLAHFILYAHTNHGRQEIVRYTERVVLCFDTLHFYILVNHAVVAVELASFGKSVGTIQLYSKQNICFFRNCFTRLQSYEQNKL